MIGRETRSVRDRKGRDRFRRSHHVSGLVLFLATIRIWEHRSWWRIRRCQRYQEQWQRWFLKWRWLSWCHWGLSLSWWLWWRRWESGAGVLGFLFIDHFFLKKESWVHGKTGACGFAGPNTDLGYFPSAAATIHKIWLTQALSSSIMCALQLRVSLLQ